LVEEELRGAGFPHLFEHLAEEVGAIEEEDEHRHIHFGLGFHGGRIIGIHRVVDSMIHFFAFIYR
jgi:predicted DNA-binding protein with PD1-like motif